MKIKHENTVKLTADEITKILVKALNLPQDTKATFDLTSVCDQFERGSSYQKFSCVRLVHTTEKEI